MQRIGRITLLFMLSVIVQTALAQNDYYLQHYSQANGLPQNSVNALQFSPSGYLWFTTEVGVVRFDGHRFKVFVEEKENGFNSNRYKWILPIAYSDQLIVSSALGRLFLIKENKIKEITDTLKPRSFHTLSGVLPDPKLYQQSLAALFYQNRFPRSMPIHICELDNGNIAVAGKQYIYLLNGAIVKDSIPIPYKNIYGLYKLDSALYLVHTNGQMSLVDLAKRTFLPYTNTGNIPVELPSGKLIYKPTHKSLYYITANALYEVLPKNNQTYTLNCLLKNINIHSEVNDIELSSNNDIIAIGTVSDGLYLYRKKNFYSISKPTGTHSYKHPYYAFVCWNDSFLVSAHKDVFLNHTYISQLPYAKDPDQHIAAVDHKNRIVLADKNELLFFSSPSKFEKKLTLPFYEVNALLSLNDSLYVFGRNELCIYKNETIVFNTKLAGLTANGKIQSVLLTKKGQLFIGSCEGLYQFSLSKGNVVLTKLMADICVRQITEDSLGTLFLATYGNGIWVNYKNEFVRLPEDNGLYTERSHSIQFLKNRIWISTNNGMVTAPLSGVYNYLNGQSKRLRYHLFDAYNGIENPEFNGGCIPSSYQNKNGDIYFSSMGGIVRFNPLKFNKTQFNSDIFIDEVIIDGVSVNHDGSIIRIDKSSENIAIRISSPYWRNEKNISYQYQLFGFNNIPILTKAYRPNINYTKIPGGEYTLKITKITSGYFTKDESISIRVIKEKKWHETFWFKVILVVASIFFIYLFVYINSRRLKRKNELLANWVNKRTKDLLQSNSNLIAVNQKLIQSETELKQSVTIKNRLISIVSHDILTPLRFISMVARHAQKPNDINDMKSALTDIHNTSIRLYDNAQNILNWIKYQNNKITVQKSNVALYALVEELTDLLNDPAKMNGVSIRNEIQPDDIVFTDPNILSIILHNLIANAVKYTRNSVLMIATHISDQHFEITVSDTGSGIPDKTLLHIKDVLANKQSFYKDDISGGHGLGYIIVAELSLLVDANIIVNSGTSGTSVTISIAL